jgi:glycosyltransferase 2 family protein
MLRWVVRAVVSVSVVGVLVSVASTDGLRDAFSEVRGSVWLASLVVFLVGHALNAAKFRWLLQPPRPAMGVCLRAHFAGLVANLGLPGVAGGDVVRATYLLPHGVSAASVTVAGILDRVIDTAMLACLIGIGALLAGVPPALAGAVTVSWPLVAATVAAGALGATGLVWWWRRRPAAPVVGWAFDVSEVVPAAAAAALVTVVVQSAFVMVNVWMAGDLGLDVGIAPWFVAWPLSKIIAILPISLGGLGVREAALVSLLAPYGASSARVFVSGLLWQGVLMASGLLGLAVGAALGARPVVPSSSVQRS